MRKDQIETAEISDAELDNVAGGVLNGAVAPVSGVVSTVGGVMSDVDTAVSGVSAGNGSGNVNVGGVNLGAVSGMVGGL